MMQEFGKDSEQKLTTETAGRTVDRIVIDDEGMGDYLVIIFRDGSALRMRYDWIYEWEVTPNNVVEAAGASAPVAPPTEG